VRSPIYSAASSIEGYNANSADLRYRQQIGRSEVPATESLNVMAEATLLAMPFADDARAHTLFNWRWGRPIRGWL
jgi:hypothetical protein